MSLSAAPWRAGPSTWTLPWTVSGLRVFAVTRGSWARGAGGPAAAPLLPPDSRDLVLTPVAPHLAPAGPLVLPGDAVIDLIVSAEDGAAVSIDGQGNRTLDSGDAVLDLFGGGEDGPPGGIDGQVNRTLDSGDGVSVCRSPHVARFLRLSEPQEYYRILAERLQLPEGTN